MVGELINGVADKLRDVDDASGFEKEWEAQKSQRTKWCKEGSKTKGIEGLLVMCVALEELEPRAICFTAIDAIDGEIIVEVLQESVKDYVKYKNKHPDWIKIDRRQHRALPADYLHQLAVILDVPMKSLPDVDYGYVIPAWIVQERDINGVAHAWAGKEVRKFNRKKKR